MRKRKLPDIIVIDSSIWISALHFRGVPLQALVRAARCHIVCCATIREEVARRLISKYGWSQDQVHAAMGHYIGSTPDIITTGNARGLSRDPNDDVILECAIIAKARYLISGDKDLLTIERVDPIVLTARQYLDLPFIVE